MWDEIKKHPYVILGVVGGIILLFLLSSSGSTTAVSSDGESDSDVAAAEATNQAQVAANAQVASYQIQEGAQAESDASSLSLAQIQANTTDNANNLSAAVAAQQINAQEDVTNTANTLSAQTTQYGEQQQTQQLALYEGAQTTQTAYLTNALVSEAQIASSTTLGVAGIQAGVANQATAANQAIQTQSWFSKIF